MERKLCRLELVACLLLSAVCIVRMCQAATTIDVANPYAYAANTGWINARGDETNGAVIGQFVCSGYLYGANVGWISLGNGAPTNGVRYGNASADDCGVNNDGLGNLYGYAYGANIGWINFETNYGKPKVDLLTGNLGGYVWSANAGWISLSNAQAFVKTDTMDAGPDTDGDGIPDQWELAHASSLTTFTASGDFDGDKVPDKSEYASDTDPADAAKYMKITSYAATGGVNGVVTWLSEPTRVYRLEAASTASNEAPWSDVVGSLIPPSPPPATETTKGFTDSTATQRFYRVKAVPPLSP